MSATKTEWWRKPLRTAIQLLLAGVFTGAFQLLAGKLPVELTAAFWAMVTIIVSAAQNYAEAQGWVKPLLLGAPSSPPAPGGAPPDR